MSTAFVLMTAMPPTKGHFNLMNFASWVVPGTRTKVIVCTQPGEPYAKERYYAIQEAAWKTNGCDVKWLNQELTQDSTAPGFWPMWDGIMKDFGFMPGDFIVSSEGYGATLAGRLGGHFIPYDPHRELYYTKATNIREHMVDYFDDILPEFQHNLRTTITLFGAESTGKTTLSKALAEAVNGHWIFEWARPYLELTGAPINAATMTNIWTGQRATQKHTKRMHNKPFVIQDTDLFSTVGYWEQPHWEKVMGERPQALVQDANDLMSDLYIMTRSNIPFEEDPLRYGGDKRESNDDFWIGVARKYKLPLFILDESDLDSRLASAVELAMDAAQHKAESIFFEREANGR